MERPSPPAPPVHIHGFPKAELQQHGSLRGLVQGAGYNVHPSVQHRLNSGIRPGGSNVVSQGQGVGQAGQVRQMAQAQRHPYHLQQRPRAYSQGSPGQPGWGADLLQYPSQPRSHGSAGRAPVMQRPGDSIRHQRKLMMPLPPQVHASTSYTLSDYPSTPPSVQRNIPINGEMGTSLNQVEEDVRGVQGIQVIPKNADEYDPAMRHPVFFSKRMVKLPAGVVGGNGVATGWQLEEERRRNAATRL